MGQICKHDIYKTDKPICLQIGTSGPQANDQLWESVDQSSRSQKTEISEACDRDSLKTNEQILLQIGRNGLRDK